MAAPFFYLNDSRSKATALDRFYGRHNSGVRFGVGLCHSDSAVTRSGYGKRKQAHLPLWEAHAVG